MRSIEKSGVRLVPLLAGAVGGAYLLPLLAAGVVGSFSRYMADDFCTAAVARALGRRSVSTERRSGAGADVGFLHADRRRRF